MYYAHPTRKQRYQIERLIQEGVPSSQIALKLGVHRSTVYRERRRGVRVGDRYLAALAQLERTSRYLVLRRPSRRPVLSAAVARSVVKGLEPLKAKSITFDNGAELARYEQIQTDLRCPVFFADPRSPNQRATCENTIGLVRQYLPKGVDLSPVGTAQVARIDRRINHRPRHCLGFLTSSEVLFNKLPDVALRA